MQRLLHLKNRCAGIFFILFSVFHAGAQQHNFKRYSAEYGIQATVSCMLQDQRGYIWIGTANGGLNRFDGRNFVNYSKADGISSTNISGICEDKNGNLWIATPNGLNYFDGRTFKTYGKKDGLSGDLVMRLRMDYTGNLWIVTLGGLCKYDGKKFTQYGLKDGLSSTNIKEIYIDHKNRVWIGYDAATRINHVSRFDGNKTQHFQVDHLRLGYFSMILSFYEDSEGGVWLSTRNHENFALSRLHEKTFSPCYSFRLNCGIKKFMTDSRGTLWMGTTWGVYKANEKRILAIEKDSTLYDKNAFEYISGISNDVAVDAFEDNSGNIWFATEDGAVKYGGDAFLHYGAAENLEEGVYKIFEDPKKRLWVTSNSQGSLKIMLNNAFIDIRTFLNLKTKIKNASIFIDSKGIIWGGSEGSGLVSYDGEKMERWDDKDGIPTQNGKLPYLRPGFEDREGKIWCGLGMPGYFMFSVDKSLPRGKQITAYAFNFANKIDSVLQMDFMTGIFIDQQKNTWINFNTFGLVIYKNGTFTPVPIQKGFPINHIETFFEDSKGRLWMAAPELAGISCYANGKFTFYDSKNGYTNEYAWDIKEDKNGNVWFGTAGDGIFIFKDKTYTRINSKNGLNDNTIWHLTFDTEGNTWAGTNKGINKIRFSKNGKPIVKSYGINEGFIGVECNGKAAYLDAKGDLWFGTPKGLTKYIKSEDLTDSSSPKLNMLGIKLFFKETDWTQYDRNINTWTGLPKTLTLPYDQNHLTFSFIGISMRSSEKVRYRFMLEGEEKDWSPVTDKNEITYSHLNPGTYTFKVISRNADGAWNKEPLSFTFTILPPWWQTWWFRTTAVLLFAFALYGLYRWRTASLLKRQAILEKTVDERTAEVVHQKEVIEEKQKEILDSINYAKRIQDAILPSQKTVHEYLADSFILYLPKDIVAGDFYFVEPFKDKTIFAAADCTGHGVPGAMVSVVCANALKRTIKEFEVHTPGKILDKVTDLVLETFESSENEVKDGMDISLCTLNRKTLELEWAGANNPLWIVRNNECIEYNPDKQPIGKFDNRKPFTTHTIQLQKGDQLYIFTDGYGDQFGGPKNKKFKLSNMKTLFTGINNLSRADQMKKIQTVFDEWKNGYEQVDDVCVISVKI